MSIPARLPARTGLPPHPFCFTHTTRSTPRSPPTKGTGRRTVRKVHSCRILHATANVAAPSPPRRLRAMMLLLHRPMNAPAIRLVRPTSSTRIERARSQPGRRKRQAAKTGRVRSGGKNHRRLGRVTRHPRRDQAGTDGPPPTGLLVMRSKTDTPSSIAPKWPQPRAAPARPYQCSGDDL
jgi:hypothetical protein